MATTDRHLRIRGNYEKLCIVKITLHLATFVAAILASCACMGADAVAEPGGQLATAEEIASGMHHGELVRVKGIVSSVIYDETKPRLHWFTLRTPSGSVHVSMNPEVYTLGKLLALTDAEVEVRAMVLAENRWTRFSGDFLRITEKDDIKVINPAPDVAPEFTGDPLDMQSFARRERNGDFLHRVRLQGLLLTGCSRFLFLEASDGNIVKLIMQTNTKRLKPGTMVSATGFVSYDYGGIMMHDVVLAPAPDAPRPPPPKTLETTLNKAHSRARYTNGLCRCVVSFTGSVTGAKEVLHRGSLLWLKSEGNYAVVDVSSYYDGVQKERDGTIIRVTGVCDPAFATDPTETAFPRFVGITIIPLPEDGVVVLNPSMWTVKVLKFISVNLLIIIVLVSVALVVQRILYNRRGRQLIEERVAHARAKAKVDERTRLATELHDAVSQALTGVALQVDSASIVNRGENAALSKYLDTARQMLASCRRELRDCLWDLRSQAFDEKDMTEAVKQTIFSHTGGAVAHVRFNVERSRLSESKAHAILSMTRELVVNAVRHGKATQIWIAGECSDGHVAFSVRDNGYGFDPDAAPGIREGHFGLQGIRERVRAAKGAIKVESSAGKGAKITITLPEAD